MDPKPMDEDSRGGIEVRGGNRPADYIPNLDEEDTYLYLYADEEEAGE